MTLYELSFTYEQSASLIRQRMRKLRQEELRATDSRKRRHIHKRLLELDPILRETVELSNLTRQYYDRGYHKDEKYTL